MFTLTFHRPGSPEYDAARAGFDRAAIPTPELTLTATSDTDVVTAVRYAADHDLPVAVRATGHGPVAGVDGGMLIDTRALNSVRIDGRTAVLGAGTTWTNVLARSGPLGLAPLCGSAPDVGAVSYSLGGGLGPLGRRHGWAADQVRRLRMATADGRAVEVTPDTEPALFWALRGGGGTSAWSPSWRPNWCASSSSTAVASTCPVSVAPSCSRRSAGPRRARRTS